MDNSDIRTLIASLKKEQADSPDGMFKLLIPGHEDTLAVCSWNDGIDLKEISTLLQDKKWFFSEDYLKFLQTTNGCSVFKHPRYGGGVDLLDIQRMVNIHNEVEQIPDHWYPVAWTSYIAGAICIDSERCRKQIFPYIYFLNAMHNTDEAIPIYCDFKAWFERLIICQGVEFWLWEYHDKIEFKS